MAEIMAEIMASKSIARDVNQTRMFINGEAFPASSGRHYLLINPATEAAITEASDGDASDIDRAVQAARTAFEHPAWKNLSQRDRGRLLWKLSEKVEEKIDEFAQLETITNGKPIFESRYADLRVVIDCLQYYAGWATKLGGDTINTQANAFTFTTREPVGVVGAIVAWNFPLMLAVWKIAPALAAGNTVVLKPAPNTPLSALKLAQLAHDCGFPPGVLNVVTGMSREVGACLVAHPGVDRITFTGSTSTGRDIVRRSAESLKKISLELGGKSPNIVFDDADLDAALRGATTGIFYGKGEVCAAGSRLLVQKGIYASLLEKLTERAKKILPMDPLDPKCRLGALASEAQLDKVQHYVQLGKDEGARLVAGGNRHDIGTGRGYFFQATIFADVENHMRIAREEIFGPVLAVIPFSDTEEAIRLANDSSYGLAAGVWTRDIKKAHRLIRELHAGTVWVNAYNTYDVALPFGGYKQSGFGRDQGEAALEQYTQLKTAWIDLS